MVYAALSSWSGYSPPRGNEEARSATVTLNRQGQFLRAVLPPEIEVRFITLQDTSAYAGSEVVQSVREALQTVPGRTMLVTTTLDRGTRSQDGYQKLKDTLKRGSHMAVSLLWDTRTALDPAAAMLLSPGV